MAIKKQKINIEPTVSKKSKVDQLQGLMEENLRQTKAIRAASNSDQLASQKELQKLLAENLKISKDLYQMMRKINRWVVHQKIWGIMKILIIAVPIILSIIYLPPLLKPAFESYQKIWHDYQQIFTTVPQSQSASEDGQKIEIDPQLIKSILEKLDEQPKPAN